LPASRQNAYAIQGGYVSRRLHQLGYRVRIADITPQACLPGNICTELLVGNLCDRSFCTKAVRGVHTVLHFAATMGGMGTIHSTNDFVIYSENHAMMLNMVSAAVKTGVKRFLYASSACVYPECLQEHHSNADISLKEDDVWNNPPPKPQGLYGLEKLASEMLLQQHAKKLDIRIARFHNVYGPGGAWNNGREKAPAALLRKALAIQLADHSKNIMEIWGNGLQRRSFLWIEDCVDAVLCLLQSSCTESINIGSTRSVTIKELADIALRIAGANENVEFQYDLDKPVGVASRNSNNDFVHQQLGWEPTTPLEEGMHVTGQWIHAELKRLIQPLEGEELTSMLQRLERSQLVNLQSDGIVFAILLPITSRGSVSPQDCLRNLARFAQSLLRTTWRDTHELGGHRFGFKLYLAIDEDDEFLWESLQGSNKAKDVLEGHGISDIVTLSCNYPRGHVCSIWRKGARRAWEDGCEYIMLMGDDVSLEDEGWMRDAHSAFMNMSNDEKMPSGFGCVAFTDTTFPGMPTFPIVHRMHMDIFEGEVVPQIFVNQDGDPFLFQLYRRWNCSRMFSSRIRNGLGGSEPARYTKQHATDWTFETLDRATTSVEMWLSKRNIPALRKLTLDVIIPCYRVQMAFLEPILQLRPSGTCNVMFIVIIDNPQSPHIAELLHKYAHRSDIRIRINAKNMGASASRNRGMQESAAEWIHFLDDDISPRSDIFVEAEKLIRTHPRAAGFVGNALFPPAHKIFPTAVHLAGVTYFWDIANKISDDVPWGVTANLIARRDKDDVYFNLQFPKTGGGEDIDFCRRKRQYSMEHGGEGFCAAPNVVVTHPWWYGGKRSYKRFYMWAIGDGALVKIFSEHTYIDHAPNSAEQLLICTIVAIVAVLSNSRRLFIFAGKLGGAVILSNVIHDMYRHLWRNKDRTKGVDSTLVGTSWLLAVVESTFVRIASEMGRTVGMLLRGEFMLLGRRFDWFTGRAGNGPRNEERRHNLERIFIFVAIVACARDL
jgi:nucleoside-diphosphate-sugar epimerase/glycosyltransferase involved in cell wall biosynthesis